MSTYRLNQYLARCGVASRRKADDLIVAGQVTVNTVVVTDFGYRVAPDDSVSVRGKSVRPPDDTIIIALNKPRGVTTTKSDPHATKTVFDVLPKHYRRLNPVGRLDRESEGLLLLTDDGDLHHELTHPSFQHDKEYVVGVKQPISDADLQKLASGIRLHEGRTAPTTVTRISQRQFTIVLRQGWNRQIRRMLEAVHHQVVILRRIRIGQLELGDLQPGQFRVVTKTDILR